MNPKAILAVAAFAALAGGAARADDIAFDNTPFQSGVTRAEVQAELAQHRKETGNAWANEYEPRSEFKSTRTRAQVQAELAAYRKGGVDQWSLAYEWWAPAQAGGRLASLTPN
jgi:hypothetical protein